MKDLEEKEGESAQKEEENAEQLVVLEARFKDAEVRFEAAERQCNVLSNNIKDTKNEIETWCAKTAELEKEMEDMDDCDLDD